MKNLPMTRPYCIGMYLVCFKYSLACLKNATRILYCTFKHDGPCTCNITLGCFSSTIFAVEKQ